MNQKIPQLINNAYIEMYVGNIFLAKNFFVNSMQFIHVATKREEKLLRFLLQQGDVCIVLVSELKSGTDVATALAKYGDCVKKLSFWVDDPALAFERSVSFGAIPAFSPAVKDGVVTASVEMFNGVLHEFLKQDEEEQKLPGFAYHHEPPVSPMLFNIDHVATCHPAGSIKDLATFYGNVFECSENINEDVYALESGMHIIIMTSPNGRVNLPLVEPSSEASLLNAYLEYNHGSGVHHIAFETADIVAASKHYEAHHGELRKAKPNYYEKVKSLYPAQVDSINQIKPYGIMLEEDSEGVLFQIFTKPVVTRPTFFLEFLQRGTCQGFGTVNIEALYETL